jgi:hypothetical protein
VDRTSDQSSGRYAVTYGEIVVWAVAGHLCVLLFTLAIVWVSVFYFHRVDASYYMTFRADDVPTGVPNPIGFGVHTFGDFLLGAVIASANDPFSRDLAQLHQAPPLAIYFIRAFTHFLPYAAALAAFSICSAAAMLVPAMRGWTTMYRPAALIIAVTLTAMTAPFVMVLDRGNTIGFLVPALLLFATAWRERKWNLMSAAIIFASLLKLYPIVLVVVLLSERRFREAAVTILAVIALSLLLIETFPGSFQENLGGMIASKVMFAARNSDKLVASNYSLTGMFANLLTAWGGLTTPAVTLLEKFRWLPGMGYLLMVTVILVSKRAPFPVTLALCLSLLSLVLPVSFSYTFVFVFVITAELSRYDVRCAASSTQNTMDRRYAVPLAGVILASLTFYPIPCNDLSSIGTIIVPAAWLLFALYTLALTQAGYRPGPTVPL